MKYILTKHAKDVIAERAIPLDLVESAINNPEFIEPDTSDSELEHRLKKIPEFDNKVIRVIVDKNQLPIKIITAYFDRAMRGKL